MLSSWTALKANLCTHSISHCFKHFRTFIINKTASVLILLSSDFLDPLQNLIFTRLRVHIGLRWTRCLLQRYVYGSFMFRYAFAASRAL